MVMGAALLVEVLITKLTIYFIRSIMITKHLTVLEIRHPEPWVIVTLIL